MLKHAEVWSVEQCSSLPVSTSHNPRSHHNYTIEPGAHLGKTPRP